MSSNTPAQQQTTSMGRHFREFAAEYHGASPLYERLAHGVARDPEIQVLAAHAQAGQPAAHLLFAAVHLLLLRGTSHPLARFYPTVVGPAPAPRQDPYPSFRAFCLEHEAAIRKVVSTGLVQTNEPRRCSTLLPALQLLTVRTTRPLALIETGASAGLNLLVDRYGYDYHTAGRCGDPSSPVQIECEVRGPHRPPLPERGSPLPVIASRVGLDIAPVDVRDAEQRLWLRAFVWPDERGRAETLERALELAQAEPPRVLAGDAAERLPEALATTAADAVVCLIDFFTLQQVEPEHRQRLTSALDNWATESRREAFHLSVEGGPRNGPPQLRLASSKQGLDADAGHVLGQCDRHGAWLEWLQDDTGAFERA